MPNEQAKVKTKGLDIKIARIRAGLRQYEVAKSIGILPSRLSEIEAGRREPSEEVLQRLLQILGLIESMPVTTEGRLKEIIDRERLSERERES